MKNFKRISLIFLISLVLFSIKTFAGYEIGEINSLEDPLYDAREAGDSNNANANNGIMLLNAAPDRTENINSIISKFEDGTAAVGIDVSSWQGEINWSSVANSGVKYAIIRCGYRGRTDGVLYQDAYFKRNIEGAINNGIYVGVYCFSTALNEQEAMEEANMVLDLIRGYDIKYFVAYDFEEFAPKGYRTDNMDINQIHRNAQTFLARIRENGYTTSLYGSVNYLKNSWRMNEFASYDVWAAHYYVDKPSYSRYNIWQYTDSGRVPGINGNVDVDVDYTYYFKHNNVDISNYMFSVQYYYDCYPDLQAAFGYNQYLLHDHYYTYGIKEGRTASPIFNPRYYLKKYPDLKAAYGNDYAGAYQHFITFGAKEGRQGSKYIDSTYYLNKYGDLKRALYSSKTRALEHFFIHGIEEGRQGSKEFDVKSYRNSSNSYYQYHLGADYLGFMALDSGGNPVSEDSNIDITPYMFDYRFYADSYPDLMAAYGYNEGLLRIHYETFGKREGRRASRIFDPVYYLNVYPDLKAAYGNDYVGAYNHFITCGAPEGRSGSEELQVRRYLERYGDLRAAFGTFYTKAIAHYVSYGVPEGRQGN